MQPRRLLVTLSLAFVPVSTLFAADTQLPTVDVKADTLPEDRITYNPEVTTTAAKIKAPLRDIPQTVNVVTEAVMRDQAAHSLQDVLRTIPGVGLSHGDGQRDQVTIRGFTAIGDQFIDGLRDDALYFRDLSNVERIEVLKGPASVLYGRGSSGGLINRITKKPFGTPLGEVEAVAGSFRERRVSLDFNQPINATAQFRVTGAVEDSGSYRDQQFLKREAVAPSLLLKLAPDTRLLLQLENLSDRRVTDMGIPADRGRPVDVPIGTYYGSANARQDDYSQSTVTAGGFTLDHRFSPEWSLHNAFRSYAYHLDRHNTIPGTVVGTGPTATVRLNHSDVMRQEDGWFNQFELTQRLTTAGVQHQLLYGVEIGQQRKNQRFASANNLLTVSLYNPVLVPLPAYTATVTTDNQGVLDVGSAYVQDLVTLAKHWKLLAGVRYDVFNQRVEERRAGQPNLARIDRDWSPRIGLVFQPNGWTSYYASYSQSFQPSAELFPQAANANEMAPEKTRNVEIGSKLDLFGGRASATASIFDLQRDNIKANDPANPARLIPVGTQRTRGVELTLNGELAPGWQVQAGYAFLDGRITRSTTVQSGVSLEGKRPSLTPMHSANLWVVRELGQGFSAGGGVSYVGDRYASPTNLVSLGSYVTADAMLAYKTRAYDLMLSVKNLTDKKYFVSAHGGNDNLNLPGAPRTVEATLRYRF